MNDVVYQYSPQKKLYNPFNNHSFFFFNFVYSRQFSTKNIGKNATL